MNSRGRGDAGIGLVEMLIAVVLLGAGGVAVLAAMATATKSSALYENQTTAFTALGVASEAISSPDAAYSPCNDGGAYDSRINDALADSLPTDMPIGKRPTVTVVTVRYWNGSGWDATCRDGNPAVIPAFDRMQEVTLAAMVPGSTQTYTISVVKRAA